MKRNPSSKRRRSSTKSVLRLPDLEHAKAAVLNSLNSADAKRGYCHAIDEFVDWYCSEPRSDEAAEWYAINWQTVNRNVRRHGHRLKGKRDLWWATRTKRSGTATRS
jgi:hypothetical protein